MSARAAFAQLRALRASRKTRLDTYQVQDQGDIYDEVGEEDYKKVVRSRLNQDDFVIDVKPKETSVFAGRGDKNIVCC